MIGNLNFFFRYRNRDNVVLTVLATERHPTAILLQVCNFIFTGFIYLFLIFMNVGCWWYQ